MNEDQESELEALKAIYGDDFKGFTKPNTSLFTLQQH